MDDIVSKYLIYALSDPTTNQIKYIGQSSRGMVRPRGHFYPSNYNQRKTYKDYWIKSLIAKGIMPVIDIIEEFNSKEELNEAEKFWISYFRYIGCILTNTAEGGAGDYPVNKNRVCSESRRKKIGDFHRGRKRSQITIERLRHSQLNLSPEKLKSKMDKLRLCATGRRHSIETKNKLSLIGKGRKLPESQITKMSISIKKVKRQKNNLKEKFKKFKEKYSKINKFLGKHVIIKNPTGFKGVQTKFGRLGTPVYTAWIAISSKKFYIGSYDLPEEAAKAYDYFAYEFFGDNATLNFPYDPINYS